MICCFIELVVELITILIYGFVFYRYWSKRRLRKTMDLRDKARSDLYLAQLRSQSAPNTPGFAPPMTPIDSPRVTHDPYSQAERGDSPNAQFARTPSFSQPKPFKLQPPPIRVQNATPRLQSDEFSTPLHSPAAPGERQYEAVPIPGAYNVPLQSPSYAPTSAMTFPGPPHLSSSSVESPPATPRLAPTGPQP